MTRSIVRNAAAVSLTIALAASLSACGLAETGAVAATAGVSKAEEAKQAQQTQARMEQKINEAYKAAADQRHAADAESQ